jgi:hypothetical protein
VVTGNIAVHFNCPTRNFRIAIVLAVTLVIGLPTRANGFVRVDSISVFVGSVVHVKRGLCHITITLRRYHPGFSEAILFSLVTCIIFTVWCVLEIEPHPADTVRARSISLEQLSILQSDFSFAHANNLKRSLREWNIFRVLCGFDL